MNDPATRRWSDRLFAFMGLRLVAWLLIYKAVLPGMLVEPYRLADYMDDHQWYAREEQGRISMADHGQFFAWNPFTCGGIPGLANPEETSLSPDFVLRLLFGVGPGRRLAVLLFIVLGMEGTYRLARKHDTSAPGSAVAAVAFALCPRMLGLIPLGWLHFFCLELMPWVVLCFLEGVHSRPYRVLGGCFLAWMVLSAGTYPVPFTLLVLALFWLSETARATVSPLRVLATGSSPGSPVERATAWYLPTVSLVTVGLVAAALSAAKLVPMMEVVLGKPRLWLPSESNAPLHLIGGLMPPSAVVLVVLALVGTMLGDRVAVRFQFFALFFFALAMGDFGKYSPYVIMRKLPIYGQLRDPDRMMAIVVFFVCLAAGRAVSTIEDGIPRLVGVIRDLFRVRAGEPPGRPLWPPLRFGAGVVGAILAVCVGFPAARDYVFEHEGATPLRPRVAVGDVYVVGPPVRRAEPFRQSRGNRWDSQVWPPINAGILQCFCETKFPESALLRGDLPAEEYPADPGSATVQRVAWSPNRIVLRVAAAREATVLVNQNFHRSWRSSVGRVVDHDGLLAVVVPPGQHDVVLRYLDPLIVVGVLVSLLAFVGLLLLGARAVVRSELLARWRSLR